MYEGVKIFYLVGIAGSMSIDTSHTSAFRSTKNTDLSLVNVVVDAVHEGDDDACRDTLQDSLDVVKFVDGAGTKLILMDSTHGPTKRTAFFTKISVVLVASFFEQASVGFSGVLVGDAVSALRSDLRRRGGALNAVGAVDRSATELASGNLRVTTFAGHLD